VGTFLMAASVEARSVLLLVILPDMAVFGINARLDALDVWGDDVPDLVVVLLLTRRHLRQSSPVSLILLVCVPTHGCKT
jgi:hypothetical protein